MNSVNVNYEGYSMPNGADAENNWAAAYAKRAVEQHKGASVLDHPDGSVTVEKLSDEVKTKISQNAREAEHATAEANKAYLLAQSAMKEAGDALGYVTGQLEGKINELEIRIDAAEESAKSAEEKVTGIETALDSIISIQNQLMGVSDE